MRIEACGANLCGYSVDAKSNANGEQVLINMRPGADHKWSGRIHDPNSGSTYDSTIAMKGTTQLRVQGCAFGGMFCGGQTWSRVQLTRPQACKSKAPLFGGAFLCRRSRC